MQSQQSDEPISKAQELLNELKISSLPVPVEKIAKALGIQIRFSPLDDELSGMIYIKDGVPIIGVNSLHHPNRQRFTIAHEIAHFKLHHDIISQEVHVDKKFAVLMRDSTSKTGENSIEVQANRFAAELLIPQSLLEKEIEGKIFDIEDDTLFDTIAKKFKVSRQMLEHRIRNMFKHK